MTYVRHDIYSSVFDDYKKCYSPLIFASEAAGSRTQMPRTVKAVRQCAQNQKLKIPNKYQQDTLEKCTSIDSKCLEHRKT